MPARSAMHVIYEKLTTQPGPPCPHPFGDGTLMALASQLFSPQYTCSTVLFKGDVARLPGFTWPQGWGSVIAVQGPRVCNSTSRTIQWWVFAHLLFVEATLGNGRE